MIVALTLTVGIPARETAADIDRSDPLVIPDGPLPSPEQQAGDVDERVHAAAKVLREHGYSDLPILARALLDAARENQDPRWVERAVALAPQTPAVRYEAARYNHDVGDLVAALRGLVTSFPGLVWLFQVLGAAAAVGMLGAGLVVIVMTLLRGFPQHTHALGHLGNSKDLPGLPSVVFVLGLLLPLVLFGVGPALVLGSLGTLAALRVSRREAIAFGLVLALAGVCLGPLLEAWSRVSAFQGSDTALMSAWRGEYAQSLPGDREILEAAIAERPHDTVLRVGLGTSLKRSGDMQGALDAVGTPRRGTSGPAVSAAYNLRGIVELARGSAKLAIREFEAARNAEESAAVLFNLSQAYGRSLRLNDQKPVFNAARDLDGQLVRRFTSSEGRSIHDHLIQSQLPLRVYLEHSLEADAGSQALAQTIRGWTLGPGVPSHAWMILPLLGVLGVALRRKDIVRCRRCERPVCERCTPAMLKKETCVRCEALFNRQNISDPRVHGEQLTLDRRRQRGALLRRAGAGLLLPGVSHAAIGQLGRGSLQVALSLGALFLVFIAPGLPAPWEVGGLSSALPTTLGLIVLVPLYAASALRSWRGLAEARALR